MPNNALFLTKSETQKKLQKYDLAAEQKKNKKTIK